VLAGLLLAVLLVPLLPARPAEAAVDSSIEREIVRLINSSRAAHGRAALSPRSDMTLVSRRWSAQMARENRLYHNPNYSSQICCWRRVAENVAWTSTGSHLSGTNAIARHIHDRLMGSSGHRANILNASYTQIGVGVEFASNGRVWVTQTFRQPSGSVPANAIPVVGDWNGDGRTTIGWFHRGTWWLRTANSTGRSWRVFNYGTAGDQPVVGDWNRNGVDTIGVRRGETWHLRNSNDAGNGHISFRFGSASDVGVTGDWNRDGRTTVGVKRGDRWFLRNANSGGNADVSFTYGGASDVAVTGDWNGDGRTTVGVRRGSSWRLRNSNSAGGAHLVFDYGTTAQRPVAGDWNRDGRTTPGVATGIYDWRLRNANSGGGAHHSFVFGG
jgi:hypothetical protein